jgi:hypothetical protein
MDAKVLRSGGPCNHVGCLSHISHPCEECGRVGGRITINVSEQELIRIGRLVSQGIKEVLPHTGCKGVYHSLGCWEILKTNYHGCVLQYYCPTQKEDAK